MFGYRNLKIQFTIGTNFDPCTSATCSLLVARLKSRSSYNSPSMARLRTTLFSASFAIRCRTRLEAGSWRCLLFGSRETSLCLAASPSQNDDYFDDSLIRRHILLGEQRQRQLISRVWAGHASLKRTRARRMLLKAGTTFTIIRQW